MLIAIIFYNVSLLHPEVEDNLKEKIFIKKKMIPAAEENVASFNSVLSIFYNMSCMKTKAILFVQKSQKAKRTYSLFQ